MTRYFLDSEFDEDGTRIRLISVALCCEDGREYYAVAADGWRAEDCNEWVRQHVLPKLVPQPERKPLATIRAELVDFLRLQPQANGSLERPEIWGYFADYDWIVLCQLFGRMVDLPLGMPMLALDLKQLMVFHGLMLADLPAQDPAEEHNALTDARWIRDAWLQVHRKWGATRTDARESSP